ncbi:MAG: DNA polymerase III subunit delta' [Pseudomonadota bacterium]
MMEAEERPVADRIDDVPLPSESMFLEGHAEAAQKIASLYKSGTLHHAWLLSGPRGIGKATFAFHAARHLLAHPDGASAPDHIDPESWPHNLVRQVAQAAHPDLLHLTRPWDDKTKRFKTQVSVDEVRKTQAFYSMTAGGGGWRITIVDAADDMNASAANALLKILEEPPKRSIFFIVTHAAGGLLPTIRSRCQSLPLKPLAQDTVGQLLRRFEVQASEQDIDTAARMSEGSVRQAILLSQKSVLDDYRKFEALMGEGAAGRSQDWVVAHSVADSVSRRGQEDAYSLFNQLVLAWIGKQARLRENEPLQSLAGWAEVWENANKSISLADAFNLDKKQVVLDLFSSLFERNRAGQARA